METHEEYWVSGVKRNGQNIHWAGHGKVQIDKEIINEYLESVDISGLIPKYFEVVQVDKHVNTLRFDEIENKKDTINQR
ncbi:hypothetical protein AAG747_26980 [Rapidithrix thailandica]|uniref:Uncharacterized protein n=1 Tax=Rapidithrix thailandica TaxID=413964 RepID=A0AAW9SCF6_9BACT